MQSNSSFTDTIGWIFSIAALIIYAIVAFYGMEYIFKGNHLIAIGITLAGAVILGLCIWGMCLCKISRNKRRALPLGILAALGASAVLIAGTWPVTLILYAYDHEDELATLINNTRDYALRVDSLYQDYAESRVKAYEKVLKESEKSQKKGKKQKKDNSKKEERALMVNSLRRRILSPVEDSIRTQRSQWLASLPDKNIVYNISTAKNLRDVFYAADKWIDEYRLVSAVIYKDEEVQPFSCDEYTQSAKDEYDKFCVIKQPDNRSIGAMAFCIFILFLTYFILWRPKSRYANR